MGKQKNSCLSFDDIQRYINNWKEMSYDEIYAVSNHLYYCDKCAELARAARLFDSLWENWTADSHGETVKWMSSNKTAPVKGDKIIEHPACKKIVAAVRVIHKTPGKVISFLTESVDELLGISPELSFQAYSGTRGKQIPGQPRNSVMSVSDSGNIVLFASSSATGLNIQIEGLDDRGDLEVTLQSEGQEPLVADLTPDGEWEGCWHAVFSDIPLGEYLLLFKSSSNSE